MRCGCARFTGEQDTSVFIARFCILDGAWSRETEWTYVESGYLERGVSCCWNVHWRTSMGAVDSNAGHLQGIFPQQKTRWSVVHFFFTLRLDHQRNQLCHRKFRVRRQSFLLGHLNWIIALVLRPRNYLNIRLSVLQRSKSINWHIHIPVIIYLFASRLPTVTGVHWRGRERKLGFFSLVDPESSCFLMYAHYHHHHHHVSFYSPFQIPLSL